MTPPVAPERRIDPDHVAVDRAYALVIYDNDDRMVCQVPKHFTDADILAVVVQVRFAFEKGKSTGRANLQTELRHLLNAAPQEPAS